MPFDVQSVRSQFPILSRQVNNKPLVYLDSAASAQKPNAVIDGMADQMRSAYSNVHRGLHTLANETTDALETARETVRDFINAPDVSQIVFTKGATEGINLVANGIVPSLKAGDEIVLSIMEHHANIVPWHFLRETYGVVLKWVGLNEDGSLDMQAYEAALSERTRLVAITHMSNVLGSVTPVKDVVARAHDIGAEVLLDGCQAIVHLDVNVQELDCDYYVFSGHKLYGPTGIGVLFGKADCLNALRPFQGGGEMIESVTLDTVTYNDVPHKFEAGTPPILEAIGLGTAINWYRQFDRQDVIAHEHALYKYAVSEVSALNSVKIHGTAPDKGAIMTFSVDGIHAHDVAQLLDKYGVAIRAGHHCAQPLMGHLGVSATARASFAIYNTIEEVDIFAESLGKAIRMLG